MKGLIIKDLLFLKGHIKILLIILMAFVLMSFTTEGMGLAFYLPFLAIMMCISTFNYDEYNKWDTYMLSFPVKRKDIVKAKYLFTLISIISAVFISLLTATIISIFKNNLSGDTIVPMLVYSIFAISFVLSLAYPMMYKFGAEKGKIGIFVIIFLSSAIIGIFLTLLKNQNVSFSFDFFIKHQYLILSVLTFLLIYISYKVSCFIYKRKQF